MLLKVFVAFTFALIGLLFVRVFLDCVNDIPWPVLLTLLAIGCVVSIVCHTCQLKCWRFLTWQPHRLHSMTEEETVSKERWDLIPQIVLYRWSVCFICLSLWRPLCDIPTWIPSVVLGLLCIYTASLSVYSECASTKGPVGVSSSSLSDVSESEASKVNASELGSGVF